jgi:mono/diheme cytochrome c family protein
MLKRRHALALAVLLPVAALAQSSAGVPANASAQVKAGAKLYEQHCALCHGASGRNATVFPRPIWGPGHDIAKFSTSQGLFEYVQLMMPFDNPQKIGDAEKLAISAFMLERNGSIKPDALLPAGGGTVPIK